MHQSYPDSLPFSSAQAFFAQFECAPLSSIIRRGVLAPLGRILLVGHASTTPEEPIMGNDLWFRSIGVLGFSVGSILSVDTMLARKASSAGINLMEQGALHVPIETLPLTRASEAHRRLEARDVTGRVILTI